MKVSMTCYAVLVLAAGAFAAPTEWKVADGGNGHYYEYIKGNRTWTQAKAAAEALSFGGAQGHLVTIASAGENEFVRNLPGSEIDLRAWIGLSDTATEGTFAWVTGEALGYTNWNGGEPSNSFGAEDWVEMFKSGVWNDNTDFTGFNQGYVVEFEPAPPEFKPPTAAVCGTTVELTTGDSYNLIVNGGDVGDSVVIAATGLPTGATLTDAPAAPPGIAASATFAWTPAFAQAGTHVVTFTLIGLAGQTDCQITFDVTEIAVSPAFDQPTSPACGSTFNHVALKELALPVSVSDANTGGTVTLELVAGSPGTLTPGPAVGNPAAASFSWTPTLADADNNPHTIRFRATDDTGLVTDCFFTVNVLGDSDGDGLPNAWEEDGYTFEGEFVDLPSMGADPNVKDVFLEIDYMVGADHTHRPLDAAIDAIKQAFANRGIVLHVNIDEALPHQDVFGAGSSGANYNWTDFDAVKAGSFSAAKALAIHYCLMVHTIPTNGGSDSGLARGSTANDIVVSLGSFTNEVGSVAEQTGTLMHELGHSLGLLHGGVDDTNRKPNYLSVMNYYFQMNGLRKNGAFGVFDYSGVKLPTLTETGLNETTGLDGGAAIADFGTRWVCASTGETMTTDTPNGPIDWDCDGATEVSVSVDINGDGVRFMPLEGHDDWGNLNFKAGAIGTGVSLPPPPVTVVEELDLPTAETLKPDGPVKVNGHVSKKKLHVTWKPSGLKKDGIFYRVYRSADGGDPVLLGETTNTAFDDKNVVKGVAYVYTVTWVDALGTESKPSLEIELTLKAGK